MKRYQVQVNVSHGTPDARDISRAKYAALHEIAAGGDYASAEQAADLALTQDWHDPNGAACTITVFLDGFLVWPPEDDQ